VSDLAAHTAAEHGIIQGGQANAGLLRKNFIMQGSLMQRVILSLLIAARVLGILAVLAGLFVGYVAATIGAGFTCFDTCPTRDDFFSHFIPGATRLMLWCVAPAALALLFFLVYCLATRQLWRALIVLLVFFAGGLFGVVSLNGLVEQARTTLPINEDGILVESLAVAWASMWGWTLLFVATLWSGGLVCLEWGRRWGRLGQPATS
jgi:hypothetical protein